MAHLNEPGRQRETVDCVSNVKIVRRLHMSGLFSMMDNRMEHLRSLFPGSHGKPRVDGRHVQSGIIFANSASLR